MVTSTELVEYTKRTIVTEKWSVEDGRVIPSTADIPLNNSAKRFGLATFLYADLKGSTKMVSQLSWQRSAEIYKTYLYCASRLIRHYNGEVVAFDGDRVMGIFLGDEQSTNAVRCAFRINWARMYVIQPIYDSFYGAGFSVDHCIGIDVSEVRCCRTGVRGDNDLLWIGAAPNIAAKLTDIGEYPIWITDAIYTRMMPEVKIYSDGRAMWEQRFWTPQDNRIIYRSNWWWRL
jgi:class 3 adenylate cyclase